MEAGTVPSAGLELGGGTGTALAGGLVSTRSKVAVPPGSVVIRPEVGVTVMPIGADRLAWAVLPSKPRLTRPPLGAVSLAKAEAGLPASIAGLSTSSRTKPPAPPCAAGSKRPPLDLTW